MYKFGNFTNFYKFFSINVALNCIYLVHLIHTSCLLKFFFVWFLNLLKFCWFFLIWWAWIFICLVYCVFGENMISFEPNRYLYGFFFFIYICWHSVFVGLHLWPGSLHIVCVSILFIIRHFSEDCLFTFAPFPCVVLFFVCQVTCLQFWTPGFLISINLFSILESSFFLIK